MNMNRITASCSGRSASPPHQVPKPVQRSKADLATEEEETRPRPSRVHILLSTSKQKAQNIMDGSVLARTGTNQLCVA